MSEKEEELVGKLARLVGPAALGTIGVMLLTTRVPLRLLQLPSHWHLLPGSVIVAISYASIWGWAPGQRAARRLLAVCGLASAAIVIAFEVGQELVPRRTLQVADLIYGLAGVGLGLAYCALAVFLVGRSTTSRLATLISLGIVVVGAVLIAVA